MSRFFSVVLEMAQPQRLSLLCTQRLQVHLP